jgi:putative YphP/YqiW family bacilliredoxin
MYPEEFVQPMREELTRIGFQELRTAAEVDALLTKPSGTVLVVVNSICGCAAGRARPAVAMALENKARPEFLATVLPAKIPMLLLRRAVTLPVTHLRRPPLPCCATAS